MTRLPWPPIRREIVATVRLAAPLIGGQLAYLGMSFIDTVMAGNLSARALGAVAIGASVWSSLHLFLIGVLLALPPFVSELDGEGSAASRAAIAPFARQVFWVAQALGLLALLVASHMEPLLRLIGVEAVLVPLVTGYLRALAWGIPAWSLYLVLRFLSEGLSASHPTLWFGVAALPVNALANWLLMYGHLGLPALGAVGCGVATAVVWWLQTLGFLLYLARHPRYRDLGLFERLEMPQRATIGRILWVGVPIGVALFLEGSLFTVVALGIGSLGTVVVAGHQVALNFAGLTFMVPLGLSMAITVRVGRSLGRRDARGVRVAAGVGVGLAMLCQAVSATVMLTAPAAVAGLYTDDPRVLAIAVELLYLAALFQLSDGLQVSSAGALRGLKDTRLPMLVTLVAYWLVGLPLGYWLGFSRGLGARGMWIGLIAGLTLAAVLLASRLRRVIRQGVTEAALEGAPSG